MGCCFECAFLVARLKYPPYRETPVAQPLSHCVVSQTIAAAPQLLSIKMAYPKTDLGGRVLQKKLASETYSAIGGGRVK